MVYESAFGATASQSWIRSKTLATRTKLCKQKFLVLDGLFNANEMLADYPLYYPDHENHQMKTVGLPSVELAQACARGSQIDCNLGFSQTELSQ